MAGWHPLASGSVCNVVPPCLWPLSCGIPAHLRRVVWQLQGWHGRLPPTQRYVQRTSKRSDASSRLPTTCLSRRESILRCQTPEKGCCEAMGTHPQPTLRGGCVERGSLWSTCRSGFPLPLPIFSIAFCDDTLSSEAVLFFLGSPIYVQPYSELIVVLHCALSRHPKHHLS